jgi:hypothetical protein
MTTTTPPDNTTAVPLWTTKDLAQFLGCSERQISRLREEGLPSLHVGGLIRFIPTRVMSWLERHGLGYDASDERACQLADIEAENDGDAAENSASDAFREFPPAP